MVDFFLILFLLHLLASFHSSIEKCYDSLLPTFYTPPPIFSSKLHIGYQHSDPELGNYQCTTSTGGPDASFLVTAFLSEITTVLNLTPQMSFAICKHHNGIIPHVLLVSALLCSPLYLWGFSVLLHVTVVGALSLLHHILWLYHSLSILLLMDIWIVFTLGLFWIGHYEHSCACLGKHVFWMFL